MSAIIGYLGVKVCIVTVPCAGSILWVLQLLLHLCGCCIDCFTQPPWGRHPCLPFSLAAVSVSQQVCSKICILLVCPFSEAPM